MTIFLLLQYLKDSFGNKQTNTSIKYRCYKNFDDDKFINDLENAPWEEIETIENVDEALEYWYKLFLNISNKHAPMKDKIGISDAGTPQPNRDLDAETLLVKL